MRTVRLYVDLPLGDRTPEEVLAAQSGYAFRLAPESVPRTWVYTDPVRVVSEEPWLTEVIVNGVSVPQERAPRVWREAE